MSSTRSKLATLARAGAVAILLAGAAPAPAQVDAEGSARRFEQAVVRFQDGDYDGAFVELQNALQLNPDNLSARLLLGGVHLHRGDPVSAEKELRVARSRGAAEDLVLIPLATAYLLQRKFDVLLEEIEPGRRSPELEVALRVLRGQAQLELNRLEDAEAEFAAAARLRPDDPGPRLGRAAVLVRRGRLDEAEAIVDEVLELAPRDPEAWFAKGELHRLRRHFEAAVSALDRALELDENHLKARTNRAAALIDLGRLDEALADLERVRELDPRNPQATYLTALALVRLGREDEARDVLREVSQTILSLDPEFVANHAPSLLLAGFIQYGNGSYEEAFANLVRYLDIDPSHVGARKLAARILVRRGEPLAAIDMLEPALAGSGDDPAVYAILGEAYERARQPRRAVEMFERAVSLAPRDAAIRSRLAMSRVALGASGAAIRDLEAALEAEPAAREPAVLLAQLHLARGEHRAALRVARQLAQRFPDDPLPANLEGGAEVGLGRLEEAEAAFRRAVAIDPTFAPARVNLAEILVGRGRLAEAREQLEAVLAASPGHAGALSGLAGIARREGRDRDAVGLLEKVRAVDPRRISDQIALVGLYLKLGEVDEANRVAEALEAAAPENVSALLALGRARLAAGNREHAQVVFRRAAVLAGHAARTLVRVARYQRRVGDEEGARWSLQKAVEGDPGHLPAWRALVAVELDLGRVEQAMVDAQSVQARFPESEAGDVLVGDVLMRERRYGEALAAYERAMAKADREALAIRRFRAARGAGRAAEALADLERWVAAHPRALLARRALAAAYLAGGRTEDARATYEALLAERPDDAALLNGLAWAYQQLEDPRALETARRAYGLAPRDASVLDTLGWVLARTGAPDKGLKYLREAHSRASTDPRVRYHLGATLAALGRETEARRHVREALRSGETFEESAEARRLLATLGGGGSGPVRSPAPATAPAREPE